MRKILLSLSLVACAAMVFAQSPTKPTIFNADPVEKVGTVEVPRSAVEFKKAGATSRATPNINYNFAEAMEFWSGNLGSFRTVPLFNDSIVRLTIDGGGFFHWWQHAYANTLDPTHTYAWDWLDDIYPTELGGIPAEHWFNDDHEFNVDSFRFYFTYRRDNPSPVADTLFIYTIEPEAGIILPGFTIDGMTGDTLELVPLIRYDYQNNEPDFGMAADASAIIRDTILLTFADTSRSNLLQASIDSDILLPVDADPTDGNEPNLCAWGLTFKTGLTYSVNDTLVHQIAGFPAVTGNPLNVFRLLVYEEEDGGPMASVDDRKYTMASLASSQVRYNTGTSWDGFYIAGAAFVDAYSSEHVYTDWIMNVAGVMFEWNPGCANGDGTSGTDFSFIDMTNFQPTAGTGTYAWNFGDGGTASSVNPSHQYMNAGTYDVSLTVNQGGRIFTYAREVIVPWCRVGLGEENGIESFTLYPNPIVNELNLDIELNEQFDFNISIVNLAGQVVHTETVDGTYFHTSSLDVSAFPAGMYQLNITSVDGEKSFTENFVIGQ